jgi:hypothetical protein
MTSTLRDAFLRLSTIGKARVFARLIHAETVRARDAYVPGEDTADGVRLRTHNEEVHRMSGRLMALLGERVSSSQDDYIVGQVEFIAAGSPRRREELERWIAEAEKG